MFQGKKKVKKAGELGQIDWEGEREHAMRAFLQILQLNVNRLWDPPVVEEEFVKSVSKSYVNDNSYLLV